MWTVRGAGRHVHFGLAQVRRGGRIDDSGVGDIEAGVRSRRIKGVQPTAAPGVGKDRIRVAVGLLRAATDDRCQVRKPDDSYGKLAAAVSDGGRAAGRHGRLLVGWAVRGQTLWQQGLGPVVVSEGRPDDTL